MSKCELCGKETCDCGPLVGWAAAVLEGGDPKECKRLHRRYNKLYPDRYELLITTARKLVYYGGSSPEYKAWLAKMSEKKGGG